MQRKPKTQEQRNNNKTQNKVMKTKSLKINKTIESAPSAELPRCALHALKPSTPCRAEVGRRLLYALTFCALSVCATGAVAGPAFQFQAVTFLGDAAPGGGVCTNDFEPSALN